MTIKEIKESGRRVLITGGSRGIGRDLALAYAQHGYKVAFTFVSNEKAAQETAQALKTAGASDIHFQKVDVSIEEQVKNLAKDLTEKWKGLDVLVNNAGISRDDLLMRVKSEDWDLTLNTNLKGAMLCAREFSRPMMRNRDGVILFMSSVIGEMGNAGQAAYAASKAGMLGLMKSLARELASRNIRVNAITPGYIETEMTGALEDSIKQSIIDRVPLGRIGEPAEVAQLAVFLSGPYAQYITGQTIGINGGLYI